MAGLSEICKPDDAGECVVSRNGLNLSSRAWVHRILVFGLQMSTDPRREELGPVCALPYLFRF